MKTKNLIYFLITSLLFSVLSSKTLAAEKYPAKEIQVVLNAAAGGFVDISLRLITDSLAKNLGVPVIVNNRPGAGGADGTHFLLKAKPDGYNIGCFSAREMVIAPATIPSYPYKPSDLDPLCKFAESIAIVFCKADAPWKTMDELLTDAKKRPKKITYGASTNSSSYFTMAAIQKISGVTLLNIPLANVGQTITRVLGGNLEIGVTSLTPVVGQLEAGTIRGLLLTTTERIGSFPHIPTLREKGYESIKAFNLWAGFFAPLNLPKPIRQTLEQALEKTLKDPAVKKKLEQVETSLDYLPSEAFAKEIEEATKQVVMMVGTVKPQK